MKPRHIRIHGSRPKVATPSPHPGPSPAPPLAPNQVVIQLVFHLPDDLLILEGTGIRLPDGSIDVELPSFTPPAVGTIVQIVILGPGDPTMLEGTTGATSGDGSTPIELVP